MIRRITLKCTQVEASALGFGCASLTMLDDRRKALALLDEAFERGITHYDVAPLYGFGQTEGIVGEFLRGRRDRVTVATKFGLAPPPALSRRRRIVNVLRWVSHRLPLAASLARKAIRGKTTNAGSFTPAAAARSLENSLKELGTDYVDLFLLHEGTPSDAGRPELLDWLERQVAKGTIRTFGIASGFGKLLGDALPLPPARAVLQFDSSVLAPNVARLGALADRGLVTFGAVSGATRLAELARTDRRLTDRHRSAIGEDLTNAGVVAGLMLRFALAQNSDGIVLFATTKANNLRANAHMAEGPMGAELLHAFEAFATEAAARLEGPP